MNHYNNAIIIKMLKNILIIYTKIKGKNKFENNIYFFKKNDFDLKIFYIIIYSKKNV